MTDLGLAGIYCHLENMPPLHQRDHQGRQVGPLANEPSPERPYLSVIDCVMRVRLLWMHQCSMNTCALLMAMNDETKLHHLASAALVELLRHRNYSASHDEGHQCSAMHHQRGGWSCQAAL